MTSKTPNPQKMYKLPPQMFSGDPRKTVDPGKPNPPDNKITALVMKKMAHFSNQVDAQIMLCDDYQESLALACVLMVAAKKILINCTRDNTHRLTIINEAFKGILNDEKNPK